MNSKILAPICFPWRKPPSQVLTGWAAATESRLTYRDAGRYFYPCIDTTYDASWKHIPV
jgi:hypothetical protein